jgi:transcriptional regulator with XRE-family HTH domain
MSFADNLQAARKKNGLTQEDLAGMLDVSRQAVSKWEQGDGYPEAEKLLILSDKLDISLDELMGRSPRSAVQAGNTYCGDQASSVSSFTAEAGSVSDAQFSGVESYIPPQPDDPLNWDEDPEKETPEAKHNRLLLSIALVCIAVIVLLFLSGLK